MDQVIGLIIFWGVWLLIPMVVDGITTLYTLLGVSLVHYNRMRKPTPELQSFPLVSIIIPVYNSEETLEACLRSIADQDYPNDRMEVHLINNGSSDQSHQVFTRIREKLDLHMGWISTFDKGKSDALNAGIYMANGVYIFNIDSDVVLAPDAVRKVVEVMEYNLDLGAVTGAIQVLPPDKGDPALKSLLANCEFFEYLTAFHVGREHQSLMQSIYTLSGAFSVFRRELLLRTDLYRNVTVTEDTDLTFELHDLYSEWRIACVSSAVAYVHPIESLSSLYAQRVRWQRGQVEVSARYEQLMNQPMWLLRGFSPARTLLVDHTLAFPRIVWTFLLPILALFGYPLSLIVMAFLVLYGFYLLIDLAWIGVAWIGTDEPARKRLIDFIWMVPVMPFYRMVVFWFRISGFLHAIAEPGVWRVEDPLVRLKQGLAELDELTGGVIGKVPATLALLHERFTGRNPGGSSSG